MILATLSGHGDQRTSPEIPPDQLLDRGVLPTLDIALLMRRKFSTARRTCRTPSIRSNMCPGSPRSTASSSSSTAANTAYRTSMLDMAITKR